MTARTQSSLMVKTDAPTKNDGLLRNVLRANAAISALSGLLFITASQSVAHFLGIAETQVFGSMPGSTFIGALGVVIVLFALGVAYDFTRPTLKQLAMKAIIVADVAWVATSVLILLTGALPLTTAGSWAVLIAGDLVTALAILEYVGLRRLNRG
jgi:hypothetical protein